MRPADLLALARSIDPARAPALESRYAAWGAEGAGAASLATVVVSAFPAFGPLADAHPAMFRDLYNEGWRAPRTRTRLLASLLARTGDLSDTVSARSGLRVGVHYEKLRIATRELLPRSLDGADVDTTAAEISILAEASIEIALAEAMHYARTRWGPALTSSGAPSTFVVIGMGKLGGRELNAGSDIDVLYLYDTDDGASVPPDGSEPITLHAYWSQVARRLTANLDATTPDGMVWRVDLRLRPEGSQGPVANALPAAERYYETFGRLWERAAMVRARPVAGDLDLGKAALDELSPFVYSRHVDPHLAVDLVKLGERARTELSSDPARDMKLGPGGIRDAELFVQTLQLVWGGKEPRVRTTGTLDALKRLRAQGLVTDREEQVVESAYLLFRRVEHRVQWATGLQTHLLPIDAADRVRLARTLGYADETVFARDVDQARAAVSARLASLLPPGTRPIQASRFAEVMIRLEGGDAGAIDDAIARSFGSVASADLCRDVRQLARRPDDLLGSITRERLPELCTTFLESLVDAADPEQAARYVRTWLGRLGAPGVYVKLLGEDLQAARRVVAAFGASAFIGNAIADHPGLGESVVFARRIPNATLAEDEVAREVGEVDLFAASRDDPDAFVGALRRAKARITLEVALADLAGEIGTREATVTLSALADATLERATRFAMGSAGAVRGLAVVAMGKLGGNEIGYGSDLDVVFVFDPSLAPAGVDAHSHFAKLAQRVIRLVSAAHPEGAGYDLDTRLRPSGSQGLLVTSLEAFARYHDVDIPGAASGDEVPRAQQSGADWERQALVRARFAAGDPALGRQFAEIADAAAYERNPPVRSEVHRVRMRMERELGRERPGRHDLKVGRGGLCDIEFAVQYTQMVHGRDPRVRTTETPLAITVLNDLGLLAPDVADTFREGYRFLRRLEQRIRVVHGQSSALLDETAEGLGPLARRMGIRDTPTATATEELVARYRDVTEVVRRAYLSVMAPP